MLPSGRSGARSRILRVQTLSKARSRESEERRAKPLNSQSLPSDMYFLQQDHLSNLPQKCLPKWGTLFQSTMSNELYRYFNNSSTHEMVVYAVYTAKRMRHIAEKVVS